MGIERHFWDNLEEVPSQTFRLISEEDMIVFYEHGFVDAKKVSLDQWQDILKNFPQHQGKYRLSETNLYQLSNYLYQGPIRRPFNPEKLKEGPRDPSWLDKLYVKVIRFETKLNESEWQDIVRNEIMMQYNYLGQFVLDTNSKNFINALIEKHISRLRRLELWVHVGPPDQETRQKSLLKAVPIKIEDSFESSSSESKKIKNIEKVFYSHAIKEKIDDNEALNFLDELESWGDDEESPFS